VGSAPGFVNGVGEVLRDESRTSSVKRLCRRDLEHALEFVHATASMTGPEPFPESVVDWLARLVPAESVVYYEWDLRARRRPIVAVEVPEAFTPPDAADAAYHYCSTYPLSVLRLAAAQRPCVLSDFVSGRALHRLDYYHTVLRPMGIEHQLRLWLPAPPALARVFYFNRRSVNGDFGDRERGLLEVLRPFLGAMRERFELREPRGLCDASGLTQRESEILEWVACGKTNREIAALLVVTTHTVRKHLENIYAKLGVHTRTAAAARFLGVVDGEAKV
jgi:DNA-binding CsgD family transcriptional regulator